MDAAPGAPAVPWSMLLTCPSARSVFPTRTHARFLAVRAPWEHVQTDDGSTWPALASDALAHALATLLANDLASPMPALPSAATKLAATAMAHLTPLITGRDGASGKAPASDAVWPPAMFDEALATLDESLRGYCMRMPPRRPFAWAARLMQPTVCAVWAGHGHPATAGPCATC